MDIDMDDDASLDEYFDNYVPLSNLPTPPPSSISNSPPALQLYSDTDVQLLSKPTHKTRSLSWNVEPPEKSANAVYPQIQQHT